MNHIITRILIGMLAYHAISCAPFLSDKSVRFIETIVPGEHLVKIDGHTVGIHKNLRGDVKICGHLNTHKNWLVVEDGCDGDSYPRVSAYRLVDGDLRKSVELEQINKEHYFEYSQGRGLSDPVFLGFDPSGAPFISSASGKHTLQD